MSGTTRAMVLERTGSDLVPRDLLSPRPEPAEVLVEVRACGVCRTDLLRGERVLRSVTNLTRCDGVEFLALAARTRLRTVVRTYELEHANHAIVDVRGGDIDGAAVLLPGRPRS